LSKITADLVQAPPPAIKILCAAFIVPSRVFHDAAAADPRAALVALIVVLLSVSTELCSRGGPVAQTGA